MNVFIHVQSELTIAKIKNCLVHQFGVQSLKVSHYPYSLKCNLEKKVCQFRALALNNAEFSNGLEHMKGKRRMNPKL